MTSDETLGLLVAPLVAASVCAMPVLAMRDPAGASSVAFVYLVLLGIAPNFALGRRGLAYAKARGSLTLGMSVAGGALAKIAVVLMLAVVGPPIFFLLDHGGHVLARWSELARAGAWASPVVGVLGAIEGAVFWGVSRWRGGRFASSVIVGGS